MSRVVVKATIFTVVCVVIGIVFSIGLKGRTPLGFDPENIPVKAFTILLREGGPYSDLKEYYRHTKVITDPRYMKKYGFGNQCSRIVLIWDIRIKPRILTPDNLDQWVSHAVMRIRCEK
jgi:hypothetical protein